MFLLVGMAEQFLGKQKVILKSRCSNRGVVVDSTAFQG